MVSIRNGAKARKASLVSAALAGSAALGACFTATKALAADEGEPSGIPDPSIATSLPSDLADPGGIRRGLAGRGITFGVNYIGEVFGVASGGLDNDTHYDGRLELVLDAELEKLIGWKDLYFHANGYQIHGTSITADGLGALMPVSFIEANPATRLFELWLEQRFLDDKVSIRVGQLAADSEFLLSEGAGAFINGTWGWPSITADNLPDGGPAYPLATPGVRLSVSPNDNLNFMVGVFNGVEADHCPPDGDPQECNPHGLDFPLGDDALIFVEAAFKYNQDEGQLPGTVKLGGWQHTGEFDRFSLVAPFTESGDHGLYIVWDQMLFRLPGDDRSVSFFTRFIGSPSDLNFVDFYAEGGITVTGLLPSRPADVLGIGFAYTGISSDAQRVDLVDEGIVVSDYESLLEISYTAEIVPGWTLQPDFQYFWNPGVGVPSDDGEVADDALVLGIRTTLNY